MADHGHSNDADEIIARIRANRDRAIILVIGTDDDDDVQMFREAAAEIERLLAQVAIARSVALEEAAKVASDDEAWRHYWDGQPIKFAIAAAIHALKENNR